MYQKPLEIKLGLVWTKKVLKVGPGLEDIPELAAKDREHEATHPWTPIDLPMGRMVPLEGKMNSP